MDVLGLYCGSWGSEEKTLDSSPVVLLFCNFCRSNPAYIRHTTPKLQSFRQMDGRRDGRWVNISVAIPCSAEHRAVNSVDCQHNYGIYKEAEVFLKHNLYTNVGQWKVVCMTILENVFNEQAKLYCMTHDRVIIAKKVFKVAKKNMEIKRYFLIDYNVLMT